MRNCLVYALHAVRTHCVFFINFDAQVIICFHLLFSLDGNNVTTKGVGMLADALKMNQSLQSLRSVVESSACQGYKP